MTAAPVVELTDRVAGAARSGPSVAQRLLALARERYTFGRSSSGDVYAVPKAGPPIARLVRGEFLTLREREFVLASIATGASSGRIIFRHVFPNALTPVIVNATFGMASAILLEAGLSFLGLGVQPPTASWGNMLNGAQSITILEQMPWLWIPPGVMIVLAVLSINFVGDGLRDALDPRSRK